MSLVWPCVRRRGFGLLWPPTKLVFFFVVVVVVVVEHGGFFVVLVEDALEGVLYVRGVGLDAVAVRFEGVVLGLDDDVTEDGASLRVRGVEVALEGLSPLFVDVVVGHGVDGVVDLVLDLAVDADVPLVELLLELCAPRELREREVPIDVVGEFVALGDVLPALGELLFAEGLVRHDLLTDRALLFVLLPQHLLALPLVLLQPQLLQGLRPLLLLLPTR